MDAAYHRSAPARRGTAARFPRATEPSHSAFRAAVLFGRRDERRCDASLTVLLGVQGLTLFVALPLGAAHPMGRVLLDACHLAFVAVCVTVPTRHRAVQGALLAGLAILAAAPMMVGHLSARLGLGMASLHEGIALTALCFNGLITVLVARHVFGPGRVTAHRVRGAVLLYLNVAALFAISYGVLEAHAPGAIAPTAGGWFPAALGARVAELSYFSLATITTTGYGDFVPVHPFARALANLEAVFGQLFPATLLARLIALHLAHRGGGTPTCPVPDTSASMTDVERRGG